MLSLIIITLLYFFLFYAAINAKNATFLGILIVLRCLYDYLFIEIGYIIPSVVVSVLKPFQELIILIGFTLIMYRKKNISIIRVTFREKVLVYCVFIPLVVSIVSSAINGMEMSILISGFRCFFIPIFCGYIITYWGRISIGSWVFELISVLIVSFAIYQALTFSGNLNELWVYDSQYNEYGENEMDKVAYNFIKNDSLRAISFFVTPIDLSVSSAICALFFICSYHNQRWFKYTFFILLSIFGVLLSKTRIGFFTLLIGVGVIVYLKVSNIAKKSFLIFGPVIMIAVTLAYIYIMGDLDLSALGRLEQYIEFKESFSVLGLGLGNQKAVFGYDSYILCCLNLFGITGILYFSFYICLFSKAIDIYNYITRDIYTKFTIVLSASMLYVFGFHHIAGSFIYWLVILLLFNTISLNKNECVVTSNRKTLLCV